MVCEVAPHVFFNHIELGFSESKKKKGTKKGS